MKKPLLGIALGLGTAVAALTGPAIASSHREAPFITELPKVDGTDLYMFRSYETGRSNFVTIIANYIPLQDPYGGPNYFQLDPDALYEVMIDNNGDAVEDLTFQFRFQETIKGLAVPAGGVSVEVPLKNIGPIGMMGMATETDNLNVLETFNLSMVTGPRRASAPQPIVDADNGSATFRKPVDNIGPRSLPNYNAYARDHIRPITIPGCATAGRVFVGQRREGFAINLGQVFDLVNTATISGGSGGTPITATPFVPVGEENRDAGPNVTEYKNITSMILELPISCLTNGTEPVIGGWMTASLPQARLLNSGAAPARAGLRLRQTSRDATPESNAGEFVQVSRLGAPLVNEVVIGLRDKDRFNGSEPRNDGQFLTYVTNPALPELLEILFGPAGQVAALGVQAPNLFPRADLIAAFLTGVSVPGAVSNMPAGVTPSEMLRLNTTTPVTMRSDQSRLGVIGGDVAGFPNGRRPGDDVTDIELRVAMGRLISLGLFGQPSDAPSGNLDFTDGAMVDSLDFPDMFPYLADPLAGSRAPE